MFMACKTRLIVWVFVFGCSTACSQYRISSYLDNSKLSKVNKFTAVWIPNNIYSQGAVDDLMFGSLCNHYVPFQMLFKPTRDWDVSKLRESLAANGINHLLVIGPSFIVRNLPKDSSQMISVIPDYVDYDVDIMGEVGFAVGTFTCYMYDIGSGGVSCVMLVREVDITTFDVDYGEMVSLIAGEIASLGLLNRNPDGALIKK